MVATELAPATRRQPQAGTGVGPTRRVRLPWLAAALAAALATAVLVLWGFGRASDRREVLMITQEVAAGEAITAEMLGTTFVAVDSGATQLYSAGTDLTGTVAAVDLAPGDLVGPSMVAAAPTVPASYRQVGALVRPGRYPTTIERGDELLAVPLKPATPGTGTADTAEPPAAEELAVTVIEMSVEEDSSLSAVLAATPRDASRIAQLAANDQLVLVRAGS